MLVLGITTSTPRGGVALVRDGQLLACVSYAELRAHAERLFAGLDEVCQTAGVERQAIDAVACDVGPGSFTGVRVGVAAATGLSIALEIPAVGVTSLEAIAAAALARQPPLARVAAALDAQKDELYLASYELDAAGALREREPPRAVTRAQALEALQGAARSGHALVGAGVGLVGLTEDASSPEVQLPDPAWIARVAQPRVAGVARGVALAPCYVRPPDITLKGGVAGRAGGASV